MLLALHAPINGGKDTAALAILHCMFKSAVKNRSALKQVSYIRRMDELSFIETISQKSHINDLLDFMGSEGSIEIKKFADPVTKIYKIITGIDYHLIPREEKEAERNKYKTLAEKCKTIFGDDVWANSILRYYAPKITTFIISDLRFKVEFNAIKSLNGLCIKIIGRGETDGENSMHISEKDLNDVQDWDYILDNSGDLNYLYANVEKMLDDLHIII